MCGLVAGLHFGCTITQNVYLSVGIFDRKPNVEKLKAEKDAEGLIKALDVKKYRDVNLLCDADSDVIVGLDIQGTYEM